MLVVLAFLLATTVGCERAISTPEHARAETALSEREIFERKRQCMEVGLRASERLQKTFDASTIFLNDGFNFDRKRNTCIWHGGYMDAKNHLTSEWIIDTFTNVQVA